MIDMNKKYTFHGKSGKVVMVDRNSLSFPVLWVGYNGDICSFTSDGRYTLSEEVKLIEVKPTRWINVYPNNLQGPYNSRELADVHAWLMRIACIEFTEGEGL